MAEKMPQAPDAMASLRNWQEQWTKREQARAAAWAKLTPEQRKAALDRQQREQESRRKEKLIKALQGQAQWLAERESSTIGAFAACLAGLDPEYSGPWGFWISEDERNWKNFVEILESCVDVSLLPLNRQDPREQWRFTTNALMTAAESKLLGYFKALAELIVTKKGKPQDAGVAPAWSTLSSMGTQTREAQKAKRHKDLVKFAQDIAGSGKGSATRDAIILSIRGVELNKEFRAAFPAWSATSDKTLERDRSECKPRIEVATGRPRNRASQ